MTDEELIKFLGGPSAVARHLGFTGKKGVTRVCMWAKRGIPAKVKLENLGYFVVRPSKKETPKK